MNASSYEVRVLRFAAIYLMAPWLKSDSGGEDPDRLVFWLCCSAAGAAIGLRIDTDGRTAEEVADAVVARSEWAGRIVATQQAS